MKRIKKALLLPLRAMTGKSYLRLYYWSDLKLYELRAVYVMPKFYYRWLYRACMWLVAVKKFQRLADRAMHTIPYDVRFDLA